MLHGGSVDDVLATVNFGSRPAENFAAIKRISPESAVDVYGVLERLV